MQTVRVVLCGLGNVGRSLLGLFQSQENLLRQRYGIEIVVVGAADSGGSAIDQNGLGIAQIITQKEAKQSVALLPSVGRPDVDSIEILQHVEADLVLESTLANLVDGQPGLDIIRTAFARGMSVVTANKSPLMKAFGELTAQAESAGLGLRYSACVGGYLPSVNIGRRDLAGAQVTKIEAVLNGTTQGILRMMEQGESYAEALAEMQRRGLAEADPSLDVDGWDAANKILILANAVLRRPTTLDEISVTGISELTSEQLQEALANKQRIVLLCLAEQDGDDFRLSVKPTALPLSHPLGRMEGDEMGIVYYTDIGGRTFASSAERGPTPTSAAMLRDLVELYG